jgi:outer membrane immunogenic protein
MKFKTLAFATCFTLATAVSANAADMTIETYDWSGPYIGLQAGYLMSSTTVEDLGVVVERHAKTNGFVGGILGGYNWQDQLLVYGLDADFGLGFVRGHGGIVPPPPPVVQSNTYDLNWISHIRGRAGFTPGNSNMLLFATAGVAFADFEFTSGETGERQSATYVAPSIGAGLEYGFTPNFTGRTEVLYDMFHMGHGLIALHDYKARLNNATTIRVGFSYKF